MKGDIFAESLYKAVLSLETEEECKNFFEDLCTIGEIKAMSQRMEVAIMLDEAAVYNDIIAKTGASSATVSRVAKCLNYGAGGYEAVLKRIKK